MCQLHYARWYKAQAAVACSVDGCLKPAWARGWCGAHYMHWHIYGTVDSLRQCIPDFFCSRCKQQRTPVDFWPHTGNTRGHQYWCKTCLIQARRERARQPESPHLRRKYKLRQYGLSIEQYDALYTAQGGLCAVCGVYKDPWQPTGGANRAKFLVVDHDHSTGRIRGLLCTQCNVAIGQTHDNPSILRAAAAYLERSRSNLELDAFECLRAPRESLIAGH